MVGYRMTPNYNLLKKTRVFSTFSPTQKKVAFALYLSRISNTRSVTPTTGPSSKVRYKVGDGDFKFQIRSLAKGLTILGVLVK